MEKNWGDTPSATLRLALAKQDSVESPSLPHLFGNSCRTRVSVFKVTESNSNFVTRTRYALYVDAQQPCVTKICM